MLQRPHERNQLKFNLNLEIIDIILLILLIGIRELQQPVQNIMPLS